jgi:hypothetical protein
MDAQQILEILARIQEKMKANTKATREENKRDQAEIHTWAWLRDLKDGRKRRPPAKKWQRLTQSRNDAVDRGASGDP